MALQSLAVLNKGTTGIEQKKIQIQKINQTWISVNNQTSESYKYDEKQINEILLGNGPIEI